MENLMSSLPSNVINALMGYPSNVGEWKLRRGETYAGRMKLLDPLATPSAKSLLLDFLRKESVPKHLANRLLDAAKIPLSIPEGAMRVLRLGKTSGHPVDYPVRWDRQHAGADWHWRRTDMYIAAIQLPNGSWMAQPVAY